jgi:uncharacterized protein YcnI
VPRPVLRLGASLLLAVTLVALRADASSAHVVPSPSFVESGAVTVVELAGPNERAGPMTGFAIRAPEGIRIVDAEPTGTWRVVERTATQTVWVGGSLPPNEEVSFRVELEATAAPGPVALEAEQRYPEGEIVRWQVPLTVVPGSGTADQNLGAALVVGLVGLLVIALVVSIAWRRGVRAQGGADG